MGLVLTLEFKNGDRTIEIDGDKNIAFLDYDVTFDIASHEFGYPETEEAKFYRAYRDDGVDPTFIQRREWMDVLVEAIRNRAEEAWSAGFDKEEVAKLLYYETLRDEDNDYRDDIIEIVGEGQLVDWLIDSLADKLGEKYSNIDDLTNLIEPYINKDDITVSENIGYDQNSNSYENMKVGDYSVSIGGKQIASWRIMSAYQIYDPVGFNGNVDSDFNDEGAEDKDSTVRSFLETFDIKLAEFKDPEPPDHPESDEDGDFAVLYQLDPYHFGHGYEDNSNIVVPYKTLSNAEDAMELSLDIFRRDGDEKYVDMTIMRRLTDAEQYERDMARRQMRLIDDEHQPEEWEDEWVLMTEEEKHADKKKRFPWL